MVHNAAGVFKVQYEEKHFIAKVHKKKKKFEGIKNSWGKNLRDSQALITKDNNSIPECFIFQC